jgi:hypothetical protein
MDENNKTVTSKLNESEFSHTEGKFIDEENFNEDLEESNFVEKRAVELKPYFSPNALPSSLYLQQNVLPLVFEALAEVEKNRPKDPIEFFCTYILENNKKEIP